MPTREDGPGNEIREAYGRIFGPRLIGERAAPLSLASLRAAFRARAFEVHPDRASVLGRPEAELASELRLVVLANELLGRHLAEAFQVAARSWSEGASVWETGGPLQEREAIPKKPLPLGEFLYFSAQISRQDLDRALLWQRESRPKFGELAFESGLLTRAQLSHLLREKPSDAPLGEVAVARYIMSEGERDRVLYEQKQLQRPIGQYFVEANVLPASVLQELILCHREHNERVPDAA